MATPLFNWLDSRAAGLLLHPTSLPGPHGIGTLGAELRSFIIFMRQAGFRYWQMLPPGPTGFGDCPYSSFSAMAGNPYLIDLNSLLSLGLLEEADLSEISRLPQEKVDFGMLYRVKWPVLKLAYRRFAGSRKDVLPGYGSFRKFKKEKASWLDAYALFMALKAQHNGKPWYEWEGEYRSFSAVDEKKLSAEVREAAEAQRFYQYLFFGQWGVVRKWAAESGISIIGDMPFYVSRDSADIWGAPENFDLDEKLESNAVAGVPPDYFSADGQLWGNPLYRWDHLKKTGYKWWLDRLSAAFDIFDVVRLDHFRAFHDYWSVPAAATTARKGKWILGPDMDFMHAVSAKFGTDAKLIAEDLGDINDGVRRLLENSGLPGMAVLHFAFSGDASNSYLPHNHQGNQVLYAGTHDNDTTLGWYSGLDEAFRDQLRRYFSVNGDDISWDLIRCCYRSVARLAVVCAQDLLQLGRDARMNTPGTSMGNWQWRMTPEQFRMLSDHTQYLHDIGQLYGRMPKRTS